MKLKTIITTALFVLLLVGIFTSKNNPVIGQIQVTSSGNLACAADSDCPLGECPDGFTFQNYSCLDGICNQLEFFVDPCFMHNTSSSGGGVLSLSNDFSGIWRGKVNCKNLPKQSSSSPGDIECIVCAQIVITCPIGFVVAPQTCTECSHCIKCSQKPVLLRLCVRNGKIEGTVHLPGTVENGVVISQTILSEDEVRVTIEDRKGKSFELTLILTGKRSLIGSFNNGQSFEARKISQPKNCINSSSTSTSGSCTDCSLVKCVAPGKAPSGCKIERPMLENGCKSCCPVVVCPNGSSSGNCLNCAVVDCAGPQVNIPEGCHLESKTLPNGCKDCCNFDIVCSSSGDLNDCSSKGSCRGQNGTSLPCPTGTECSGLPAYGCFPPGCPVPKCLSPDTLIRTPGVQKKVTDIFEGDLVISDEGKAVKVLKTVKIEAKKHKILFVLLNDGRQLEVSPEHPTADGRKFKDLKLGDGIDGRIVVETKLKPYTYKYTYDILPDSETGNYYANGILIGSTLKNKFN